MRRSGKPIAVTGAALVLLALGPAAVATAGTHVLAIVHGCPGGNVCLYGSQSAFKKDQPTVIDTDVPGLHSGGVPHNEVVVNNSIEYHASQGGFHAYYLHGTELCEYLPDSKDEQNPNRIENPADGASVTAIASGSTMVDSPFFVSVSYCNP
jgi:hypothetical protein